MQLYYAPNTISVAVAIALEEAGIDYEAVKIDFAAKEQTGAAYAQINPKGRVPALAVEGGILTETGALLEYIADMAPEAGLRPQDPVLLARMREVMFYLASTMHVNHAHRLRGARWAKERTSWKDMQKMVPQTMAASCGYISQSGLRGPFVLGDEVSLADCYLYVVCTWLEGDGVNTADFPKIQNFMTAMEQRPSVRAVYAKGML
ncbi:MULTISPECIES: glutathione S-transferase family protein [unclassified Leisingera]|uniref:glutathione S-transferase family protein n=1 Tax=unclassified Leisingera TaxID=2614906 RepID=UPI00031C67F0|nr:MULTISPECIES: glutathione S-transferase family protein [unclassified Leisingera]KIC24163.1 glutathione S-transferase [Leisingera sp. ANG-S3]KIC27027.1 glutathione S-transferase [Leisingera sp. ANG-M6]KIC52880.1 glutathione S-transferase [Leisingera sp. ANG-S]KID07279.1 glutathione S-transferase [Leisingera sp. ANG1]